MGLDTSHGCYHGTYTGFYEWRCCLREAAHKDNPIVTEYVPTDEMLNGDWPHMPEDPLDLLLYHFDCEGHIRPEHTTPLADRLEELLEILPADRIKEIPGTLGKDYYRFQAQRTTRRFIAGLRKAAAAEEFVEFH